MSECIAGIGSRVTPEHILKLMTFIAYYCRDNDIYVRSGHAQGADYAFEKGACDHGIVYLPWSGFNSGLKLLTKHVVYWNDISRSVQDRAMNHVFRFHPHAAQLSSGGQKLHGRNYLQIMGSKPKPKPVSGVICWTPGGRGGGGTGQAIRIAEHHGIRVLDLGLDRQPLQQGTLMAWVDEVTARDNQKGQTDSDGGFDLGIFPRDREEGCH